ncbi:hypothetical protein COJ27_02005 [Bacillus cereus]|uniref:Uncharacterized protein n=1 Tax=Bacillus cereus TaxID=1396 RepID=A0A9X6Z7M5_BACCE|nr:hypothetical protein CN284_14805 [Bacillus cereus]PFD18840.1 hypothetical protein CN263_21100 [Bacillus cereus]PFL68943.1 hypothetical protein COJ27_02005 [Bacillus cereus]PGW60325.1 hypothetical protein COE18_20250 [Bacillus cereus]
MTFNLLELNVDSFTIHSYVKCVSRKILILGGIIISGGRTSYINIALWKLKYLIAILMKEFKYEINIFQHITRLQQLEIMNE